MVSIGYNSIFLFFIGTANVLTRRSGEQKSIKQKRRRSDVSKKAENCSVNYTHRYESVSTSIKMRIDFYVVTVRYELAKIGWRRLLVAVIGYITKKIRSLWKFVRDF